MSSVNLTSPVNLTHRGTGQGNARSGFLVDSLVELVRKMKHSNGELNTASWADHDYEYLEVTLPGDLNLDLDLNVLGSKVFIRLNRRNDPEETYR